MCDEVSHNDACPINHQCPRCEHEDAIHKFCIFSRDSTPWNAHLPFCNFLWRFHAPGMHSLPFCIFSGDFLLLDLHSLPFCIFSGDSMLLDLHILPSASSLEILPSQSAYPSLKIPRSYNPYPTILHVV